MNEHQAEQTLQILTAILGQVAGLREDIKKLTTPPAQSAAPVVPDAVQKATKMLSGIPKDVMEKLGVVGGGVDPNKPWFKLVVKNGEKTISVKLGVTDLRLRLRDFATGELIKEATCGYNALPNALLAIVE